ncbi:MAG TPA: hypothetical protein VGD67_13205 [Pseudonocardiaceae bacterium]
MFVVLGSSTCGVCQQLIKEQEVRAGGVVYCDTDRCDYRWTSHFHRACGSSRIDATCVCKEPWAPGVLPHRHAATGGQGVAAAPASAAEWLSRLRTFLTTPPAAGEWTYLGYRHKAHELGWAGVHESVFGAEAVHVFFHVHEPKLVVREPKSWLLGGAWLEGHGGAIKLGDEQPGPLVDGVTQLYRTPVLLDRIMTTHKARYDSDPSNQSWRKNK